MGSPLPGLIALPIWFLAIVGFIGGYLAFGLAALRSDAHSAIVGLVLSVLGVIIVLMVLQLAAGLGRLQFLSCVDVLR